MKSLLLFFALCIGGAATAATYYISPLGNDISGNGSIASPWKTLKKATTAVTTPGDIIFITAGEYIETQVCDLAVGVSIDGTGITSVLKSTNTTQWNAIISAGSAVQGTNGNQYIANIKIDGRGINAWGIYISCRSNFSIYNCTFVDIKERGVHWAGVASTGQETEPNVYSTGNKFYNNTMTNCAEYSGGWGRGSINIGGQDGMLIYGNTITLDRPSGQNGYCIKYANNGWLKNIKVYNNNFFKTPIQGTMGAIDWPFAIEFARIKGGVEIYNNVFIGAGIDNNIAWKGTSSYSVWIHHNTVRNITPNAFRQAGVILEFTTEYAIIEDNVFDNITFGVLFTPRSITENAHSGDINNITIQKNLMTLTQAEGGGNYVFIYGDVGAQFQYRVENINIYSNTMIWKSGYAGPWGLSLPFTAPGGYVRNFNIKNNIMAGASSAYIVQCGSSCGSVVADRVSITNNNIYSSGNSNLPWWMGPVPTNYTYANNINIIPTYGPNYTLMVGSAMIDKGTPVGLPFAGAAPDAGYFEFGFTLPIKLIDFTVKENAGKHLLRWNTSTEFNSSHFSVERSSDGVTFNTIGRVDASGNSSIEKNYSYTDEYPLEGINYYRLKMIDLDASFEYSKIVSIKNKTADQSLEIVRVNLTTNTASLTINSKKTQTVNLSIIDASGRILYNSVLVLQQGNNNLNRNIPALSKGVYYVKIFTPEETLVKSTFTQN